MRTFDAVPVPNVEPFAFAQACLRLWNEGLSTQEIAEQLLPSPLEASVREAKVYNALSRYRRQLQRSAA